MLGELSIEVGKRLERMGVVKTTLILAVAALYLSVMARSIRPDAFVPDIEVSSSFFKKSKAIAA